MLILAAWIHFDQPGLLAITLPLTAAAVLSGATRRVATGRRGGRLLSSGLVLLSLAAGGPIWERAGTGTVAVMVDLSASTRGAAYRQRDVLEKRIAALLGDTPSKLYAFADGLQPLPAEAVLGDLPADRTRFTPPAAEAVLLFSDGQFELPAIAPPTFAVVDSGLEHPADAAMERLEVEGGRPIASVRVSGPARTLSLGGDLRTVEHDQRVAGAVASTGAAITARLSPGDRWPENDVLTAVAPPPTILQSWWVGGRSPGPPWMRVDPVALPSDPLALLNTAVVVLDDVPGDAISLAQAAALQWYVHDAGGGLLILGGSHTFEPASQNVTIAGLAPLTPTPPTPTQRWVLLGDGSGSMAGPRWDAQAAAVREMLPLLPPRDSVRVGSFARALTWWANEQSAAAWAEQPLPPINLFPHGPTELEAALRQVVNDPAASGRPTQLLLITDADAALDTPGPLLAAMRARHVTFNLLAVGDGGALTVLRRLVSDTGGRIARSLDPYQWAGAGREWVRGTLKSAVRHDRVTVAFENAAAALGTRATNTWERTWVRAGAVPLASGGPDLPMAAEWSVGSGAVAAAAFAIDNFDAEQLAAMVMRTPADVRFTVTITPGATLGIRVDAADARGFLDQLKIVAELQEPGGSTAIAEVPQTAPGRYELQWTAPRRAAVASVSVNGHVVQRIAVAGRYAPEFEVVGNDRTRLSRLASNSGGAMIEPGKDRRIQFHWPVREVPLTHALALIAAALMVIEFIRRA